MRVRSALSIRAGRVRTVEVPMRRPLAVSTGQVTIAPMVLLDLYADDGPVGSSYVFAVQRWALAPLAQLIRNLVQTIEGELLAPLEIEATLQKRMRLVGAHGLTLMALAAIDMAAWDALAKSAELPLAQLLGASLQPTPAYNSNGLGIVGTARAAAEARELREPGFRAVKVRLGYPDAETDLAVVRAVREAVGADTVLMADYNQILSVADAIRRGRMLDDENLLWIEEPVAADDARGHAEVRRAIRTAVQTGENWAGPHPMAEFLRQRACDFAMPDVAKIGGVSAFMRAAALAESAGIPMSSHLFPEISAHLLAATPTRHWLEYVDWAEPILRQPLRIENGLAHPSDSPGSGIEWNEDAISRFEV
ncbi:MAG: enolase C-terminal domain-like protein [Vulcanimicrobiaceae bacterium]